MAVPPPQQHLPSWEAQLGRTHSQHRGTSSQEAQLGQTHSQHRETSSQEARVGRIDGPRGETSHPPRQRILPWIQPRWQSVNPNSDDDWPSQTTPNPPTMASDHRARQSSRETPGVWTHGQQRRILPWVQSRLRIDNLDPEDDWVSQTALNPPTMASDHRARQSSSSIISSIHASTLSRLPSLDRNIQRKKSRERNYPVRKQDQEDWRRQQAEETSRMEAIAAENASRLNQRRPRRPWSATETDRLLDLWKRYGNNWAVIKEEDESMAPSVLGDRSIVDLKDKMRTVKVGLLRWVSYHPAR
jgi:hypothetical protein